MWDQLADPSPLLAGLQTSQGVPVRRFQTLGELIGLYVQPNQGLVCALLLPVEREREPDPPDDRDASGATWCAVCRCLPVSIPRHFLPLPTPSSQPASPAEPPVPNCDVRALYPHFMKVSDSQSSPPHFTEGGRPKWLPH